MYYVRDGQFQSSIFDTRSLQTWSPAKYSVASRPPLRVPVVTVLCVPFLSIHRDPVVHSLQFLDVINMKDPSQKAHFYRVTLREVLPVMPKVRKANQISFLLRSRAPVTINRNTVEYSAPTHSSYAKEYRECSLFSEQTTFDHANGQILRIDSTDTSFHSVCFLVPGLRASIMRIWQNCKYFSFAYIHSPYPMRCLKLRLPNRCRLLGLGNCNCCWAKVFYSNAIEWKCWLCLDK